jgi:hypothetical protein
VRRVETGGQEERLFLSAEAADHLGASARIATVPRPLVRDVQSLPLHRVIARLGHLVPFHDRRRIDAHVDSGIHQVPTAGIFVIGSAMEDLSDPGGVPAITPEQLGQHDDIGHVFPRRNVQRPDAGLIRTLAA